jgi:predicted component of type VI protein secretion system
MSTAASMLSPARAAYLAGLKRERAQLVKRRTAIAALIAKSTAHQHYTQADVTYLDEQIARLDVRLSGKFDDA